MKSPNRGWNALAVVAMLVVISCSSDDVTDMAAPQAVEAGLDEALGSTVVPVVQFYGAMGALFSSRTQNRAPEGLGCPDTSGWCGTGSATCSVTQAGLAFDFNQCLLLAADDPLTVDGDVTAIPGATIVLTLTNLHINNSPAITGTGTINVSNCNYTVDVHTSNATVSGLIIQCDADPYPTGDTLIISFGNFLVTMTLDGSNVAHAVATRDGSQVALCTIALDADPLTSSCQAP